MSNILLAAGILIVIGILTYILKAKLADDGKAPQIFPYEKGTALFSPAERSFLGVLDQAVGGNNRIMGKVRLADVIRVKSITNKSLWQKAFNRIQSKHVDFAVCDPKTLAVMYVIELDDKSHNQPNRQDRDDFVDRSLQAAGIPIYHFTASRTYSVQEIQNTISSKTQIGNLKK